STSLYEGFSLGLIEAWLAGVPTVSTITGALPELQETHGPLTVGLSADPDAEELARAIVQALSDANKSVVTRCRELAWREFTSVTMAERWSRYLELLCQ